MRDRDFCPFCGQSLSERKVEGRLRDYCSECDEVLWRNAKPFAGVLVFRGGEVLLIKRGVPPSVGNWSLPAGFLEEDEPPKEAAVRELEEETGLEADPEVLELFETVLLQHPDETYVLGIIYFTGFDEMEGELSPGSDAQEAEFMEIDDIESRDFSLESERYLEVLREAYREYSA
jgi:ADP-ribose pyrophosphatase YjhB (NUDIX family)